MIETRGGKKEMTSFAGLDLGTDALRRTSVATAFQLPTRANFGQIIFLRFLFFLALSRGKETLDFPPNWNVGTLAQSSSLCVHVCVFGIALSGGVCNLVTFFCLGYFLEKV